MKLTLEPRHFPASFIQDFNSGEWDRAFLTPKLEMVATVVCQTAAGDSSVVIFDWRIEGEGPDGSRVDLSEQS